jgi:cysteinyl-tRNA synthetase
MGRGDGSTEIIMTTFTLQNTLTGKKENFVPLKAGEVKMYVCGITPYDETHVGHARCYVVFDLLKRVLQGVGFTVTHIQNFTDVDDKIIDRANKLKQSPLDFPKPFMENFKTYMKQLNVLPPDVYPLVTTHMDSIVRLIQSLVDKGMAYESEGTVYYAVRKFPGYGKLSKRKINELEVGARVEVDQRKKDPLDFALWKKTKENEPAWDGTLNVPQCRYNTWGPSSIFMVVAKI